MTSSRVTVLTLVGALLLLGASVDVAPSRQGQDSCNAAVVVHPALPRDVDDVFSARVPLAEALLLIDRNTGVTLVERNADALRVVASTVKILTALTVLRHSSVEEMVGVSRAATSQIGASIGLVAGQEYPVGILLEGLLTRSGNDAAFALAEHVAGSQTAFVVLMRQMADELGLDGAIIADPSGLADSNRLSARQLAVIADAALADPQLAPLFAKRSFQLGSGAPLPNRNLLLERYDGATGVKTGFTSRAGHALVASAERDGRALIAVVLSAGSEAVRFQRAEELLTFGFSRTFANDVATQLSWTSTAGVSTWQLPSTTIVSASGAVGLRFGLPANPYTPVTVDLDVNQEPLCRWRSVPTIVPHERPDSVGEIVREMVAHGYGAALFDEYSGSLRVPLQGGRS